MQVRKLLAACLLVALTTVVNAANIKPKNLKVSGTVTIEANWDYTITGDVPFADDGIVNIVNTDHAVVILEKVRPSAAIKLLSHVLINGQTAKNGTNCQVKMYNRGSIILPYGDSTKPLTVYSDQNYGGESVNNFGLENSGGYMNTLTAAKLNNNIRSFKLKRGYMVTFSTLPEGRGYSRCFIAADADLEVKTLPTVLDKRISSYRVFKWYDTGKASLANDTRADPVGKLNVTSCYSFGLGENRLPDAECVPHHIYEDWPSSAECGKVTYSPHLKTNNEPGNSADPSPQSVAEILNNWENLMATGMRLCSPSSHDGSLGHLREFLAAVDERGWRCDIVDLHCYWPEWNLKNNVKGWYDTYKRPIWISEWVWGSSWNKDGIFKEASSLDSPTKADLERNKSVVKGVCETWNNNDFIERYYYWNSERNCSKIYNDDGNLTPTGEYYATINSGLGYKGTKYVPSTPPQQAPSKLAVNYDKQTGKAVITWRDDNGEYNQTMEVQRSTDDGATWQTINTPEQQEKAANYTYTDEEAGGSMAYRIYIKDLNNVSRYSSVAYTSADDISAGTPVTVGDQQLYIGGNMILNGSFDLGLQGWTSGTGAAVSQPWFQVMPAGVNGANCLMCYGNGSAADAASLRQYVPVESNTNYLLRVMARNGGNSQIVYVAPDNGSNGTQVLKLKNTTTFESQRNTFNTGDNSYVQINFSQLGGKAQFMQIALYRLFDTKEAAVTDGEQLRAKYLTDIYEVAQQSALSRQRDSLLVVANAMCAIDLPSKDNIQTLAASAQGATTIDEMTAANAALLEAVTAEAPVNESAKQPEQPNFYNVNGWNTKAGTFTGGDQKRNTVEGVSCWNALWSNISATEGESKTMEINQQVKNLDEGIYVLECKATTEHYCLSDQHGFMVVGADTIVTPVLTYDYFDLQSVLSWEGNIWQTLTTTPVYLPGGSSVTVGFKGTKKGAIDNAWHQIAKPATTDKREGWWCATGFRLLYRPAITLTTTAGGWGTLCLPYTYDIPQGMTCYRVAGILSDNSRLCLEPVTAIEASRPVVFFSEKSELKLCGRGEKVDTVSAVAAENGLTGTLSSQNVRVATYQLQDGKWVYIPARSTVDANKAFFRNFTNTPVLESWNGVSMEIDNTANAINRPSGTADSKTATYSLAGAKSNASKGVVIETNGKSSRKVLRK